MTLLRFLAFVTLGIFTLATNSHAETPRITLVHVNPPNQDSYLLNTEMTLLQEVFDVAITDFRKNGPRACLFKSDSVLTSGSESVLYEELKKLSRTESRTVAVGFPRTVFALIAAKAAAGSDLVGVSVGAATTDLKKTNPRFLSVAAPWTFQMKAVAEGMTRQGCARESSLGIFTSGDPYSRLFRTGFVELGAIQALDIKGTESAKLDQAVSASKCLFLGMNISSARPLLSKLLKKSWKGTVFGVGDWTIFSKELDSILGDSQRRKFRVYAPELWNPHENRRTTLWVQRMKASGIVVSDPLVAYTYDATTLALHYLCSKQTYEAFVTSRLPQRALLRDYDGISETNNLVSRVTLKEY